MLAQGARHRAAERDRDLLGGTEQAGAHRGEAGQQRCVWRVGRQEYDLALVRGEVVGFGPPVVEGGEASLEELLCKLVIEEAEASDACLARGFDGGLRGGEQQHVEPVHIARAELLARHDGAYVLAGAHEDGALARPDEDAAVQGKARTPEEQACLGPSARLGVEPCVAYQREHRSMVTQALQSRR